MITDIQLEWLKGIVEGKITKRDNPHKWSVYMKRIRDRIDHGFENLQWVAENAPDILSDAEYEIQEFGVIKHRRLKRLMVIIKILYPEVDVELVKMRRELGWP